MIKRDEIANDFSDGYIDSNNVFRWKSNNSVPPKEILHELHERAFLSTTQFLKSFETQEKEVAEFLDNYRKSYQGPSEEEKAEMRAAFGTGETVVNAITGRRIRL